MLKFLFLSLITILIISCEHRGYDVTKFTGDYRYYADIAEFFDCNNQVKYYVADAGIAAQLQDLYQKLDVERKDDIFIQVKGYLKEEKQLDGVEPIDVFVPVELLNHDVNRGCRRPIRRGY